MKSFYTRRLSYFELVYLQGQMIIAIFAFTINPIQVRASFILLSILLSLAFQPLAQTANVGIGTVNPSASAQLDISSTNKGLLLPRMTAAQRSTISSPAIGLLVYQTDAIQGLYIYDGTGWMGFTPSFHVLTTGFPYGYVTTLAGSGTIGGTDGPAATATFYNPQGIVVDGAGNLFVSDTYNERIRKISAAGAVTTFAGGPGTLDQFSGPAGLAIDGSNNIYVADRLHNKVRKITPAGVVSTLAGSGIPGSTNAAGTSASFYYPSAVAVDGSGNVYVSDRQNNKIRKISPTGVVTTFAGSGASGYTDGMGTAASFSSPEGLAIDTSGNLYVADAYYGRIRKISPAGVVTTLAGGGINMPGGTDGIGTAASFANPTGLTIDLSGNLYVGDKNNHSIRKVSPNGVVTTVAGAGSAGSVNAIGKNASFNHPSGITVDSAGNLYVADASNNKIRKITTQ